MSGYVIEAIRGGKWTAVKRCWDYRNAVAALHRPGRRRIVSEATGRTDEQVHCDAVAAGLFKGDYLAWTLQANHQRDDWEPVPAKRKRKRRTVNA
jgi:hypothetical protein